jgi:hypothetical protein
MCGLITAKDTYRIIKGNNISLEAMGNEAANLEMRRSVPTLDVPALFLRPHNGHDASIRFRCESASSNR